MVKKTGRLLHSAIVLLLLFYLLPITLGQGPRADSRDGTIYQSGSYAASLAKGVFLPDLTHRADFKYSDRFAKVGLPSFPLPIHSVEQTWLFASEFHEQLPQILWQATLAIRAPPQTIAS